MNFVTGTIVVFVVLAVGAGLLFLQDGFHLDEFRDVPLSDELVSEISTSSQITEDVILASSTEGKTMNERSFIDVIADAIPGLPSTSVAPASDTKNTPGPSAPAPRINIDAIPVYVVKNSWEFSGTEAFQTPTTKRPPTINFVDASKIPDVAINPQAVVLIRCKYTYSYNGTADGVIPAPQYARGSGVVVSPDGYILTVAHLIRAEEINKINKKYEDTSVTWKFDSCEAAPTDSKRTPIDADESLDPTDYNFMPARVIYAPSDLEYNPYQFDNPDQPGDTLYGYFGSDLDFALLKVDGEQMPYAPLIEKLVYMPLGEPMIGLGYPGLTIPGPQSLERIDGVFNGFSYFTSSSCVEKTVLEECGLNYQTKRYKEDYKALYGKETSLGKYTSYFRGGFSGGPLFYRGAVAGILVTSIENPYSNLYDLTHGQWNWVDARAVSEFIPTLRRAGISLPTVP